MKGCFKKKGTKNNARIIFFFMCIRLNYLRRTKTITFDECARRRKGLIGMRHGILRRRKGEAGGPRPAPWRLAIPRRLRLLARAAQCGAATVKGAESSRKAQN